MPMRSPWMAAALLCAGLPWATSLRAGSGSEDASSDAPQASLEERARDILSEPASEEGYSDATRCIRAADFRRVEILDSQRLVFYGRGDTRWLNQLPRPCPGLRRRDTLRFDMRGHRLCQHDGFASVDSFGSGMRSVECYLAPFEPVSPEQVEMLKDALRAEREVKPEPAD